MNTKISDEEKLARIRLSSFFFLRTDWIWRFLEIYGSAIEILKKSPRELMIEGGLSFETAEKLFDRAMKCDPAEEIDLAEKAGARIVFFEDDSYPDLLKAIYDPPLAIYVKGDINPLAAAVAVVGARKPTNYGIRTCSKLSGDLAAAGITVVSGLARGIDTVAHDSVVRRGGITFAVLGSGLNILYPRDNKKLSEKIIEAGGAIISEFPMNARPLPHHFPRRNRIISGISHSTVVIEGGYASGSLITARSALEQGRDLLAVPGYIDSDMSKGPNKLIKEGAAVCETAMDIILSLPADALCNLNLKEIREGKNKSDTADTSKLNELEKEVYAAISACEDGLVMDGIIHKLNCDVSAAAAAVFELEASGLIIMSDGKYKKSLVAV